MSDAMELFLRRVIIDQKLPFEVVALDDATLETVTQAWEKQRQRRDHKKHTKLQGPQDGKKGNSGI
jgi:antitoxin component of RelBE/YafQ-DinJ toxin-antitoxin module